MKNRVVLFAGCASGDLTSFAVDDDDGALTPLSHAHAGSSISFAALAPDGRFLCVTNNRSNQLTSFAVAEETAALTLVDQVPIAGAPGAAEAGPTHLTFGGGGRFLLAANYRGHNVVVHRFDEQGHFGAVTADVQPGRHAHCVCFDPSRRFLFVPCLGSDLVAQYRFDENAGTLVANDPPALASDAGVGPRHLAFTPDGRRALLVGETGSTLTALTFDASSGTLRAEQTLSTVRNGYTGRRWSSDLAIAPSGRFVYVGNRAEETLAVFSIDDRSEAPLSLLGHVDLPGRTPRLLGLHPNGRFLYVAQQDSSDLAGFSVNPDTGALTLAGTTPLPAQPYFAVCARLGA